MATGPDYCTRADVLGNLYSGQGLAPGDPAPVDATRDAKLDDLITKTSRDFDHEVHGDPNLPGLFSPQYGVRTYSGQGDQVLEVDPVLALLKVEINSTPGNNPTWQDYSSELTNYKMGLIPATEGFPKHMVFRQASWWEDPFPLGNVRLTGIWGICMANATLAAPSAGWNGLTAPQIASLQPPNGGWWSTPDDVVDAVAAWVEYKFEHRKTALSERPGPSTAPGTSDTTYPENIPGEVLRVIKRYQSEDANHPKLALVGTDMDERSLAVYRWRDWLTTS